MFSFNFYLLCFIYIVISLNIVYVYSKTDCKIRLEKCMNNPSARNKPVCGTDDQTYPSRCALLRVQCHEDSLIGVKHRGRCREKQPCWAEQTETKKSAGDASTKSLVFVPSCLPDGRYAPIQCHSSTGYCWCVTSSGTPIPYTSRKHSKPQCPRRGRMRKGINQGGKGGGNSNNECKKDEKLMLMQNVVRIFRTEFYKVQEKTELNFDSSPEVQSVEWKFNQLDLDVSGNLSQSEYDQVKKLIRKVVKPKKCSRNFIKICDSDKDNVISKLEWTLCLALPKNKRRKNNARKKERIEPIVEVVAEDSSDDEDSAGDHLPTLGVLQEGGSLIVDDLYRGRDEPEAVNDCISDRKDALEEQKLSGVPNALDKIYVPECTPDGRYKRVQCYNSTGYCWCVEEDTGKPIPGTSVKDTNPKCDLVHVPTRPMKGCPDHKKREFLKNLMEHFTTNMLSQWNQTKTEEEMPATGDSEQIATWNFQSFDLDKNKALEQPEWKKFRSMVSAEKPLRKCGKKLPRHCDVNNDRKITLTEWLTCLNININRANRSTPEASALSSKPADIVSTPRRKGPNPLEILKGDD